MSESIDFSLYLRILRALERADAPYVVIGAFAGTLYGVNRATFDIDIVVDLSEDHIGALVEAFPLPRYYADPDQMRDSIARGILFNIIDTSEGRKADLIPLTMEPGYGWALGNRLRRSVRFQSNERLDIWVARPEDVIIGKLMAWEEGRADRHRSDIRDILIAVREAIDRELTGMFDRRYIDEWAAEAGGDILALWTELKAAVDTEPSTTDG